MPGSVRPPRIRTLDTREASYDPDRALWAAVLESWWADHWTTTTTETGARRRTADLDMAWLYSDEVYPGSFVWICEALDCEPDAVRAGLLRPLTGRQGRRSLG